MRKIEKIVIHCSDSSFGDAALIDGWHRERGFDGIGYHYVILNGYPTAESLRLQQPRWWDDGKVETGRALERVGAHVAGHNTRTVGVCLIGVDQFTGAQLEALWQLVTELREQFGDLEVAGHRELIEESESQKTCPNLDMDWVKGELQDS
ncbi:N-acetylmuramoyl-L-alanine amidase [Calditrichota bacterium]